MCRQLQCSSSGGGCGNTAPDYPPTGGVEESPSPRFPKGHLTRGRTVQGGATSPLQLSGTRESQGRSRVDVSIIKNHIHGGLGNTTNQPTSNVVTCPERDTARETCHKNQPENQSGKTRRDTMTRVGGMLCMLSTLTCCHTHTDRQLGHVSVTCVIYVIDADMLSHTDDWVISAVKSVIALDFHRAGTARMPICPTQKLLTTPRFVRLTESPSSMRPTVRWTRGRRRTPQGAVCHIDEPCSIRLADWWTRKHGRVIGSGAGILPV